MEKTIGLVTLLVFLSSAFAHVDLKNADEIVGVYPYSEGPRHLKK
jgi:hypothetical protein